MGGTLALEDDTLELFKDDKLLVGVVNLGIALFLTQEEACFLEPLELTLDVAGIFFYELGETTDMCFEVGVFGIDYYNLASDS